MSRLFILILAVLSFTVPAFAYDVLVVQSVRGKNYDAALQGLRSKCNASINILVASDYAELDLTRVVREDRPKVVVVLGDKALAAAKKIRKTPVVVLMSLQIRNPGVAHSNMTGIDMLVSPARYVPIFKALKTKRIGILYNPANTGKYVKQSTATFKRADINLEVREMSDPRKTLDMLASLKNKIDAIWVIPDTTAVTLETAEAYFLFAQEYNVPLVSFSGSHTGFGAIGALDIDRTELGVQAGELTQAILDGASPAEFPFTSPRKAVIKSNHAVLERFGFPPDLLDDLND